MELTENELDRFFNNMQYYLDVSRQARQSVAAEIADSFSVFDYIRLDENRLSKIIADLLNPEGPHGQGSTFLCRFLKQLENKCHLPRDWDKFVGRAKIIPEASTSYLSNSARRIDIRIELSPDFGIGIENKPWAIEQPVQLADYREELCRRYKEKYVLVFLCQQGRAPSSIDKNEWKELENSGNGLIMSYTDDFLSWLMDCRRWCQADKVRHFLNDFSHYVQTNLNRTIAEEGRNDVH